MRIKRWILATLLVTGMTVACGEDEEPVVLEEPEDISDSADVWIGAEQFNSTDPTHVEIGETFGGRFEGAGGHHFTVDVEVGEILVVSSVEFEDDLADDLSDLVVKVNEYSEEDQQPVVREYWAEEHEEREFFIFTGQTQRIEVVAPGSEEQDYGFLLTTETRSVDADAELELPTSTEGGPVTTADQDLNDGQIVAYELSSDELQSADFQMFAQRPPIQSAVDGWLLMWNVDDGQLVGGTLGISEEIADPGFVFDLQAGVTYWLIADMAQNVTDAAYQLETEFLDTSETNPMALSLDDRTEFSGIINERELQAYTDYFVVNVEPGELKKVTVEGHGELQPTLELEDADAEDGFFSFGGPDARAFSVDQTAGATLGVPEGAQAVNFEIALTDQRNRIEENPSPFYGGDDYGYTIELEASNVEIQDVEPGDEHTVAMDSPGEIALFDITADEDHLLWLDSGSDGEMDDDIDIADVPYLPSWGFFSTWTLERVLPLQGIHMGDGDARQFLLRDNLFRGADVDYESDLRFVTFDTAAPDYTDADLHDGNDSVADASALDLPVSITGEFVFTDEQEQQEEPESDIRYFAFDAVAGDHVVIFTRNGPNMESILTLVDENGDEVEASTYFMEQREAGEQEAYFDRAMVVEVSDDGEHYLAVEQYCGQGFHGPFCEEGDVDVRLFIGQ